MGNAWVGLASSLSEAVIRATAYRMKDGLDTAIEYAERKDKNGKTVDRYANPTVKVEYTSHSTP